MAFDASQTQVTALEGECCRFIMVEGCIVPIHLIVAHLAIRRELRRCMCRIGRRVVVLQVTRHASGGCACKTLRVALVACQDFMPSIQRKARCCVVVERTALPSRLGMARLTIRTKTCSRMRRIGRGVVVFLVAGNTSHGRTNKALRMALIATQPDMTTFDREVGARVVVERGRFPIHLVVTHLAVRRKLRRGMCRISRGIIIFQMASHAGSGRTNKSLRMALVAR